MCAVAVALVPRSDFCTHVMASRTTLEFLDEKNVCGQTLLHLVSRGSAIISEVLRLSQHIPSALSGWLPAAASGAEPAGGSSIGGSGIPSAEAAKYAPVLFDFKYLSSPEQLDRAVNTSAALAELDDEFFASYEEVLARFYVLFENVWRYNSDFARYLADLNEGFYIQHSTVGVLLEPAGKQLMCEALYLLGAMLLLLDARVPGPVRERLIVAHYRHRGESPAVPVAELAKLCRDTGFRPGEPLARRPPAYPEDFFRRCAVPPGVIAMLLSRLRSDDVYHQTRVYPLPEHQTFALAQQASMLYVILYFSPRTLAEEKKEMREIVDKHFSDNWVVRRLAPLSRAASLHPSAPPSSSHAPLSR